jgi:hypothetical protein
MYSSRPYPGVTPGGFPHSDISGSKLARSSPKHFAACHVLHRLLAPRHPPHALCSLTYISRVQHGAGSHASVTSEFSSTKLMLPDLRLISRARAGARLEQLGTAARSSADRRPRLGRVAHGGQGMGVLGLFKMIAGTAEGGYPRSRRMLSPPLSVVKEQWWR